MEVGPFDMVIYRDSAFDKCLESLRRGDAKGAFAARRADELIAALERGEEALLLETWRRTHHGELRIDKCRKYVLGNGYRLVCVRDGCHVALLFAGTHDDCHRWIENHRGLEVDFAREGEPDGPLPAAATEKVLPQIAPLEEPGPETDYEPSLMERIGDRELKELFHGLWEK